MIYDDPQNNDHDYKQVALIHGGWFVAKLMVESLVPVNGLLATFGVIHGNGMRMVIIMGRHYGRK